MAKPFYSIDEVTAMLGKDADEVKALAREGKLREFRDAGKVFYKAEDVDQLAGGGPSGRSGTGEIVLEAAEDDMPSLTSAAGMGSGGTSIIGLEPVEEEPRRKKEDTVITSSGIGVFDSDDLEVDADPMAKTQITPSAVDDQVSLEGTGSGSGLLDLTREADDTSLGAELLDEIYPGEEETAAAEPRKRGTARVKAVAPPPPEMAEEEEVVVGEAVVPVVVSTGDSSEGLFAGMLVAALIVICVGATVAAGATQGFVPAFADMLTLNFLYFVLGAVGLLLICALGGWFVGKATRR